MITVIASDIHGSGLRCEQLLERYRAEGASRLILLGDILYHGPRNPLPEGHGPQQVAALLNEYRGEIVCVKGNCDAEIDQMMLEFPLIDGFTMIAEEKRTLYLTHGHHYNEHALPSSAKAGDVLIHGHTHVKDAHRGAEGVYIVNPGSTSSPKDGDYGSYAVYDGERFIIKKLSGETVKTLELE